MPISEIENSKVVKCLSPVSATSTATFTGTAVDTWGYSDITIIVHVGISLTALSGSNYWTITFEECAVTTAGSFTHCADTDLEGGVHTVILDDPTEDDQFIVRKYKGKLRYVRVLGTITGTLASGTPVDAIVLLSNPINGPIAQTALVQA